VIHRAAARFWACFNQLPAEIQQVARRNFDLLKANPRHPSLHFKKVGKLWSARAGPHHRALAVEDGEDFIWVWIGRHDEYQRLIKQQG
jgi:hypothetical protein